MLHLESSYQPNMMTLSSQPSVLARAASSPSGLPLKPTPTVSHLVHTTAPLSLTVAPLPVAAPIVSVAQMNGGNTDESETSAQRSPGNTSSCGKPDGSPINPCEDGEHSSPSAEDLALSPPHLVNSGSSEVKTPISAVTRPFMPLPVYKTSTPDTLLAVAMARKNRRAQAAQWESDRKISDHSVMKLLEQYAEDAARREQRKHKNRAENTGDPEFDSRFGDDEEDELLAMDKASFADSDRMSDMDRESPMGGSQRSMPSTDGEAAIPSDEMPSMASMASEMALHPMALSDIHQKALLAYPDRSLLSSLATSAASNQGERKQKRKQTLPQQVLDLDDSGVAPAKRSLLQNQMVAPSTIHEIEQRLEMMEHQLRTIDHAKRGPVSESELRALRNVNGQSRHRNRSEGSSQNPHAPGLLNNNNNDASGGSNKGKRSGNRSTDSEEGSDTDVVGEEMQVLKEKLKEEISGYLDSFYGNICELMIKMKKEWETKAVPPPVPPTSGPPMALPAFSTSAPPIEGHQGLPITTNSHIVPPPPSALNVESVLDLPSPGKITHAIPEPHHPTLLPPVSSATRLPRESPIVTCPNGPPPPPMPLCSLPNEAVDRLKMGPLPGINMGPNPAGMFHPHFNHELSRRMLEDFRPLGPHFPCPPMPTLPFYGPAPAQHPHPFLKRDQEQTEALPLVVNAPKKKRTKVTDTRLSPRAARSILLGENGPRELHDPSCYPMVYPPFSSATAAAAVAACAAAGAPGPFHPDMMPIYRTGVGLNCIPVSSESNPMDRISPGCRDSLSPSSIYPDQMDGFDGYDNVQQTSTLTPIHLRKAKLMFFYTRYPSSAVLKVYFPDVKFNKNNTAQLVKWFSNFREFYYIQMEKYARQAIAEGVKAAEEIKVSADSELYRVLNLHYNRNNQIEVPEHFRGVVEATLREFYKALVVGKDNEQSWKKPIYKIIARLDQSVPDFFKSTNWMEQLADN